MPSSRSLTLGECFSSSKVKGREGLPTVSVTLNSGLVLRESLNRKTGTNIKAEEHLLVEKGDIAYNMMRIWQGALGLAKFEGLVSPAYVVLKPNKHIVDSRYAEYCFNTSRMIYLFWAYSYGLTKDRLRLYYRDFEKIPFALPSLEKQKEIAHILSVWDDAISTTNDLLIISKKRRKALMQKLLTGKIRLPTHTNSWRRHALKDLGDTFPGLSGKSKVDFGFGSPFIPYLNVFSNSSIKNSNLPLVFVSDAESQNKVKLGDIFFTTSSETPEEVGMSSVLLSNLENTYLNSFCFGYRLRNFDVITPNFAKHILRGEGFRRSVTRLAQGATRYNLSKKHLLELDLRLPCLREQKDIAEVLDLADEEIDQLEIQIDKLKSEKKSIVQKLIVNTLMTGNY